MKYSFEKDKIMQKEDILRSQFIARLEDALDVNFGVSEIEIDTLEKFNEELYVPFCRAAALFTEAREYTLNSAGSYPLF